MPRASGAILVHRELESRISGYRVRAYNPLLELCPFFFKVFDDVNADLVHTAIDHAYFFRQGDKPLVSTIHNFVIDGFMRDYSTIVQKVHYKYDLRWSLVASLKVSTHLTAVSHYTANLFKGNMGCDRDIRVIPNGIDTEKFYPSRKSSGQVTVLFSGNPSKRKGYQWLAPIADRLNKNIKILCATGNRNESCNIRTNLVDIGKVGYAKMPELYRSADILLAPSVREGLSLAILEAMASGLPVVTTNTSSMPELIHENKGGYLCGIGDIEMFSDRINQLAESSSVREKMGEYNRELVQSKYHIDQMVRSYRLLFEEVMDTN
jgi:glycosyltransferase involved in cell wall biosynthesis